jgi:hypothetical protein
MSAGFLQSRITVPTGGWSASWTDGNGGPLTATVAAGNYFPLELAAAFQAAIIALTGTVGNGATVSISLTTGRCTITAGAGNITLTWTSTALRDALGFTGNLSGASSATGTQHVRGLWLPGFTSKFSMYGDGANGSLVTDCRATVSPNGRVYAVYGQSYRRHSGISWGAILPHRALEHLETVVGESFESFFLDVVTNRVSWIPVNPLIRLTWDESDTATYVDGRLLWNPTFDLEQAISGWLGRWKVALPPLVVES